MIFDFPSSMVGGSSVNVTLRLPTQPSADFTMTLSFSAGGGTASPSSLLFTRDNDAQAWFRLHTFRYTAPASTSASQVVTFNALYSSPEYLALSRSIQITATSGDLSSSTGVAINASSANVPVLFPVLEVHFDLSVKLLAPDPAALLRLMMSDTALAAGVSPSRLVQLTFVQEPSYVLYQFSIAPPPIASVGEISAQQAAANFLTLSDTGNTAHLDYASYSHAIVLDLADAVQQNLASKLSQVTFSMNYNIDSLPGGAAAFEANLVRDIAAASKVANSSRIVLTSLAANPANPSGSIRATFLVTPVFIASEGDISPAIAIENFLAASKDTSSGLFTGTVTGQTTAGSASITWPQAPAQGEDSKGFWTQQMIIIIAACGGAFLLLLLIISCVACRKKPANSTAAKGKGASPQPQSRKGFDSIAVINDEPTTMKKGAKSGGNGDANANGNATPSESAGKDARSVELTEIMTDKTDSTATPSAAPAAAAPTSSSPKASPPKEPAAVDPEKAQAARVAAALATLESGEHVSPGVTAAKPAPPVAKIGAVPVRPSASGRPAVRTHPMPASAAATQPAPQPASPTIRAHSPAPVVTHGVPTRPANARPTPIRATSTSQPYSPLASPSLNAGSSSPPIRSGLGSPSMGGAGAAYPPQRPPMLPQQSQPYPQRPPAASPTSSGGYPQRPPMQPQSSVPVRPSSPQYTPQQQPQQQWQQSSEGQPPAFGSGAGSGGFSPPIRGAAPAGQGQASSFRIAYTAKKPANPSAIRRLPPPPQ